MGSDAEKRIMGLAARQHGIISADQCVRAGLSRHVLHDRVLDGAWRRVHRGIYALGPGRLSADQTDMAALLALGPEAVLSHHTAAVRNRISVPGSAKVHVLTRWGANSAPLLGVKVWRARSLDPSDIFTSGPLRMTKVARTLLDLTPVLDDAHLRVAFDSALRLKHSNLRWTEQVLEREGRGRRGAHRLRKLMLEHTADDEVTDSDLESFAMELGLATARKPYLHYDVSSGARRIAEVDFAWPRVRLAVELDSWKFHSNKIAFQRTALGTASLRYSGGKCSATAGAT